MKTKELLNGDQIVQMPAEWLNENQRKKLRGKLFPLLRDLILPSEARRFNQTSMAEADAIVVDLSNSIGFIGDRIQETYIPDGIPPLII